MSQDKWVWLILNISLGVASAHIGSIEKVFIVSDEELNIAITSNKLCESKITKTSSDLNKYQTEIVVSGYTWKNLTLGPGGPGAPTSPGLASSP